MRVPHPASIYRQQLISEREVPCAPSSEASDDGEDTLVAPLIYLPVLSCTLPFVVQKSASEMYVFFLS
jgi:hypothetical protein